MSNKGSEIIDGTKQVNGKKLDSKEMVTLDELIVSNVFTQEALINLLQEKGLIASDELIDEIKNLRVKHQYKLKGRL